MSPTHYYKCLADETRLRCLLLVHCEGELCVCELMEALGLSQPKVSRHLALLRERGLLVDRREGKWVFYDLNPRLPEWVCQVITTTLASNGAFIQPDVTRLHRMGDRPQRLVSCC